MALAQGKTVTELISEGADLVLEKYERIADRRFLEERARTAREELRGGLFEGVGSSSAIDSVVYGLGPGSRRSRGAGRPSSKKA